MLMCQRQHRGYIINMTNSGSLRSNMGMENGSLDGRQGSLDGRQAQLSRSDDGANKPMKSKLNIHCILALSIKNM